jgi:hypothetical protein
MSDINIDSNIPYTYNTDSIFYASYATSLAESQERKGRIEWSERVLPVAISTVIEEISLYSLDDLYSPIDNTSLLQLKSQVINRMVEKFNPMGIHIQNVGIGKFDFDERLKEQRFENWKVKWQAKIDIANAKCNAKIEKLKHNTYANGQYELLEQISSRIKDVQTSEKVNIEDVMLIQIIQILEQSQTNNTRPVTLPRIILESLNVLQGLMQSKQSPESTENPPPSSA